MLLTCGLGEDSWETIGLQGDQTSQSWRKSALNIHWKDWCWSWNSNTLATWCEKPTLWKRSWCWEWLKAGEGDGRWGDGWMTSLTYCTWAWENSRRWWRTGKPVKVQSMGSQRVRRDWVTEQEKKERIKIKPKVRYSDILISLQNNVLHLHIAWWTFVQMFVYSYRYVGLPNPSHLCFMNNILGVLLPSFIIYTKSETCYT